MIRSDSKWTLRACARERPRAPSRQNKDKPQHLLCRDLLVAHLLFLTLEFARELVTKTTNPIWGEK